MRRQLSPIAFVLALIVSPAKAQTPADPPPPAAPTPPATPADPAPPATPPAPPASATPPASPPPTPTPPPAAPPPAPATAAPEEGRVVEERVIEERILRPGEDPDAPPKKKKTEEEARSSGEQDDKVGLKWVWFVPDLGFSYINLKSFSETNLAVVDSEKSGAMAGFGAGVRLVFLTLGLRARHHFAMDMWQVMGELGLHFKINRIDPFIVIRGGWDSVGSFGQAVGNATGGVNVDVSGFNFGAGIGLDYFVSDNVTIGFEGSGDFLFLTRPKPPLPAGLTAAQQAAIKANPLYENAGSSIGLGGLLAARLGFHF